MYQVRRASGSASRCSTTSVSTTAAASRTTSASSGSSTTTTAAASSSSTVRAGSRLLLLHGFKVFPVLDERRSNELSGGPEIRSQDGVGLLEGLESSSGIVLSGSSLTDTRGVDIIDTSV